MRKFIKNRFKNEKGLTLVELLAVIVILAIVGTIAFVMIGNIIDNARKDAHIANAQQLIDSAKLYEAEGNQIPEAGITANDLMDQGSLDKLIDPWTKSIYSNVVEKTNGIIKKKNNKYVVILKPDTQENCTKMTSTKEVEEKDLIADNARKELCEGD